MKSKVIKIITSISLIAILGYGVYYFFFTSSDEETSINTSSTELRLETIQKNVSATGNLASESSINIMNTLSEEFIEVNVQVGDVVEKGDVLAVVSTEMFSKDVNAAYTSYINSKTLYEKNLNDAFETLDDAKRDYVDGGTYTGTLEDATDYYRFAYDDAVNWSLIVQNAQKAYDQLYYNNPTISLKLNYDKLQNQKNDSKIVASSSGVITYVGASVGNSTTGLVFTIVDEGRQIVEASVAPYDVIYLEKNQEVSIYVRDVNINLTGTITSISPITNQQGNYDLTIEVNETSENTRLGMEVNLEVLIFEKENVFVTPLSSIVEENEKYYIVEFDETSQVATSIEVTLGVENDYYAEIISSELYEGMNVLTDPLNTIENTEISIGGNGPLGGN